jgi:hypothetical protein
MRLEGSADADTRQGSIRSSRRLNRLSGLLTVAIAVGVLAAYGAGYIWLYRTNSRVAGIVLLAHALVIGAVVITGIRRSSRRDPFPTSRPRLGMRPPAMASADSSDEGPSSETTIDLTDPDELPDDNVLDLNSARRRRDRTEPQS